MSIYFTERRQSLRLKTNLNVTFLAPEENIQGEGFTNDISQKGLGLFVKEYIKPNTSIEIWIDAPSKEKSIYVKGKVVWIKSLDFYNYRIGVELEKFDLYQLKDYLTYE